MPDYLPGASFSDELGFRDVVVRDGTHYVISTPRGERGLYETAVFFASRNGMVSKMDLQFPLLVSEKTADREEARDVYLACIEEIKAGSSDPAAAIRAHISASGLTGIQISAIRTQNFKAPIGGYLYDRYGISTDMYRLIISGRYINESSEFIREYRRRTWKKSIARLIKETEVDVGALEGYTAMPAVEGILED